MRKFLILLCFVISYSSFAQRTLIYAGKLIDGKSNRILNERTILVEGSKIVAV